MAGKVRRTEEVGGRGYDRRVRCLVFHAKNLAVFWVVDLVLPIAKGAQRAVCDAAGHEVVGIVLAAATCFGAPLLDLEFRKVLDVHSCLGFGESRTELMFEGGPNLFDLEVRID